MFVIPLHRFCYMVELGLGEMFDKLSPHIWVTVSLIGSATDTSNVQMPNRYRTDYMPCYV